MIIESTYELRCEVRAVEEGHRAFVQPGGSIRVKSDSQEGVSYELTFHTTVTGAIHFHCTCKSGQNRSHKLVPCKHAALAGRRLEREKIAVWKDGLFWVHPDLKATQKAQERPQATLPDPSIFVD